MLFNIHMLNLSSLPCYFVLLLLCSYTRFMNSSSNILFSYQFDLKLILHARLWTIGGTPHRHWKTMQIRLHLSLESLSRIQLLVAHQISASWFVVDDVQVVKSRLLSLQQLRLVCVLPGKQHKPNMSLPRAWWPLRFIIRSCGREKIQKEIYLPRSNYYLRNNRHLSILVFEAGVPKELHENTIFVVK